MSSGIPWSKRDERLLRSIYPWLPISEVAEVFGRTKKAISSRAKVLGVQKAIGHGGRRQWTKREDGILRTLYPHTKSEKLAKRMHVPLHVLYGHAHALGLRKTAEYLRSPEALILVRNPELGAKYRFRKGQVPANKGLRRRGWAPGRMAETQFKKGQTNGRAAQIEMALWSFRWVDGYLMLKTGKRHAPPNTGWEYVHKLIWEQANGPLPHWTVARLWWRDGDHGNCSLANLELVAATEHMRRTTIHNLPPQLKSVILLKGALKRHIGRMEKEDAKKYDGRLAQSFVRDDRSAAG